MALLAGLSEFGGGILLLLGFLTPLAAILIIIPMLVAIVKVHAKNGLFSDNSGIEYNVVLIAVRIRDLADWSRSYFTRCGNF